MTLIILIYIFPSPNIVLSTQKKKKKKKEQIISSGDKSIDYLSMEENCREQLRFHSISAHVRRNTNLFTVTRCMYNTGKSYMKLDGGEI